MLRRLFFDLSQKENEDGCIAAILVLSCLLMNYFEDSTETFLKSFISFMMLSAALRARAPAALLPFST